MNSFLGVAFDITDLIYRSRKDKSFCGSGCFMDRIDSFREIKNSF